MGEGTGGECNRNLRLVTIKQKVTHNNRKDYEYVNTEYKTVGKKQI